MLTKVTLLHQANSLAHMHCASLVVAMLQCVTVILNWLTILLSLDLAAITTADLYAGNFS